MNESTEAINPGTNVTEPDPDITMQYSRCYERHLYSVKKPRVDVIEQLNKQLNQSCAAVGVS